MTDDQVGLSIVPLAVPFILMYPKVARSPVIAAGKIAEQEISNPSFSYIICPRSALLSNRSSVSALHLQSLMEGNNLMY